MSEAAQIRAVEINEKYELDAPLFDDVPAWLEDAWQQGHVQIARVAESDYAHVWVATEGRGVILGPGDSVTFDKWRGLGCIRSERSGE